jgi:hypothetical protein
MYYRGIVVCTRTAQSTAWLRRIMLQKNAQFSTKMAIHAMGPKHALGVHAMTSMTMHVAVLTTS